MMDAEGDGKKEKGGEKDFLRMKMEDEGEWMKKRGMKEEVR